MARRFIVNENDIINVDKESFKIIGSEVKHIQVLRHNIGDLITINEYVCNILDIKKDWILLKKSGEAPKIGEPNINLTLYIAMLKNDKLDFVLQKATEIGCRKIVPFFSRNTVVKLDDKACIKRKEKLQKIANEACKQCGRTDSVVVSDIVHFDDIIKNIPDEEPWIFAYEKENKPLKDVLRNLENIKDISIIIGPEGGFDENEVNKIRSNKNVHVVSLGGRILRADTAAINLASIIMYEYD